MPMNNLLSAISLSEQTLNFGTQNGSKRGQRKSEENRLPADSEVVESL